MTDRPLHIWVTDYSLRIKYCTNDCYWADLICLYFSDDLGLGNKYKHLNCSFYGLLRDSEVVY